MKITTRIIFILSISATIITTAIAAPIDLLDNGYDTTTGNYWQTVQCSTECEHGTASAYRQTVPGSYNFGAIYRPDLKGQFRLPTSSEIDHLLTNTLGISDPLDLSASYEGAKRFTDVFGYVAIDSPYRHISLYYADDATGTIGILNGYVDPILKIGGIGGGSAGYDLDITYDQLIDIVDHTDNFNIIWVNVDEPPIFALALISAIGLFASKRTIKKA